MVTNYEALKLCPIYKHRAEEEYKHVARMTICDAEQFLAVDLYIYTHNIHDEQLEYFAKGVLTSPEYTKWLEKYGIVFTSSATIISVERALLNKYYVNVNGTTLRLLEFAYTIEQAIHQATKKVETYVATIPDSYYAEKL